MKNIINKIKYYLFFLIFPLMFLNIIIFGIIWAFTFDRRKMYDKYGKLDKNAIIKDAMDFFPKNGEIIKHLAIIYLLIILAVIILK